MGYQVFKEDGFLAKNKHDQKKVMNNHSAYLSKNWADPFRK